MSNRNDRLKRRLEGLSTPPIPMRRGIRTPKMVVGDRVHVHETAEAIAAGVAGLVGDVVEIAPPPGAEVAVIGATGADAAVNVTFAGKDGPYWFAKDQLDIVEHAPVPENRIPGVEPKALKDVSGDSGEDSAAAPKTRPWWKFGRG
jgi:hypothetical protein